MNLEDREQRTQTLCLLVLSTIAVAAALFWLRPVLIPFVLSIFFSLGLAPLVEAQTRWVRIPRGLALLSTLVLMSVVRMTAWLIGDYYVWLGSLPRLEVALFLLIALAFLWLRPSADQASA